MQKKEAQRGESRGDFSSSFWLTSFGKNSTSNPNFAEVLGGEGLRWCCEGGAGRVGGIRFRSEGKELVVMGRTSWLRQTQAAVTAFNYTSDLASGAAAYAEVVSSSAWPHIALSSVFIFSLKSGYFGTSLYFLIISVLITIQHQVHTKANGYSVFSVNAVKKAITHIKYC